MAEQICGETEELSTQAWDAGKQGKYGENNWNIVVCWTPWQYINNMSIHHQENCGRPLGFSLN